MQTLKEVARQGRFAAMKPAAIAERLALNAAIAATPHQPEQIVLSRRAADPERTWWLDCYCNASAAASAEAYSFWPHWNVGHTAAWHVNEWAYDANGSKWQRSYSATVDDFGNLVEVQ